MGHVLNVARLEFIAQIRLKYGTSPLGWDGFTWLDNSLVFMRPFEIDIVGPNDLDWRNKQSIKEKNDDVENKEDENNEEENVITPQKFDELAQQQKSKEICVLSMNEYYWDLQADVMD